MPAKLKLGYSLRGKPAKALKLYSRGQHISALAAMSTKGVLECTLVEGGVCGDTFKTNIEKILSPVLYPFNGTNPQSILIMDNAAIHHMKDLGVLVYYLLPYSPDLNPIKELFAKLRSVLKASEHTLCEDIETLLLMSFLSVSSQDCQGWIRHAGYS